MQSLQGVEVIPMDSLPLGRPWNMTFTHIAKTGGASIEEWICEHGNLLGGPWGAASNVLIAHGPVRSCEGNMATWAQSPRCSAAKGEESVTGAHCVSSYQKAQAVGGHMHGKVPFCVLRDPVERAMSTFNMRMSSGDTCETMDDFLRGFIEFGDVDNHHTPQSEFLPYCSVRLCFERLQEDFNHLISAWVSDNVMHQQSVSQREAMIKMSNAETQLPHETWRREPGCKSDKIGAAVMAELRGKYAADIQAHAEACAAPHAAADGAMRTLLDAAAQRAGKEVASSSSLYGSYPFDKK